MYQTNKQTKKKKKKKKTKNRKKRRKKKWKRNEKKMNTRRNVTNVDACCPDLSPNHPPAPFTPKTPPFYSLCNDITIFKKHFTIRGPPICKDLARAEPSFVVRFSIVSEYCRGATIHCRSASWTFRPPAKSTCSTVEVAINIYLLPLFLSTVSNYPWLSQQLGTEAVATVSHAPHPSSLQRLNIISCK